MSTAKSPLELPSYKAQSADVAARFAEINQRLPEPDLPLDDALGDGTRVDAHVPGSVWKVLASEGQRVSAGDPLVILESMKMETTVAAPASGVVARVICREGQSVSAGQAVAMLQL